MIVKTDAIVLRVAPYANTSQVVTWITKDAGRIATLIKGARRPKSGFLGQLDLFYTCELLYYRRGRDGLHIARECCPLSERGRIRHDWRAFVCASYLSDLALHTSMDADHQPEVFCLFRRAFDHLDGDPTRLEFLYWFELQLLDLLGFAPRIANCAACHEPIEPDAPGTHGWGAYGLLCPRCRSGGRNDSPALTRDIVTILHRWHAEQELDAVRTLRCSRSQLLVFRDIFATFIEHHLDMRPDSRRIALSVMMADPT